MAEDRSKSGREPDPELADPPTLRAEAPREVALELALPDGQSLQLTVLDPGVERLVVAPEPANPASVLEALSRLARGGRDQLHAADSPAGGDEALTRTPTADHPVLTVSEPAAELGDGQDRGLVDDGPLEGPPTQRWFAAPPGEASDRAGGGERRRGRPVRGGAAAAVLAQGGERRSVTGPVPMARDQRARRQQAESGRRVGVAAGGKLTALFEPGTPVPAEATHVFHTERDGQAELALSICVQPAAVDAEWRVIGQLRYRGLVPRPAGQGKVEFTFKLDDHHQLMVTALVEGMVHEKAIRLA